MIQRQQQIRTPYVKAKDIYVYFSQKNTMHVPAHLIVQSAPKKFALIHLVLTAQGFLGMRIDHSAPGVHLKKEYLCPFDPR